MRSLAVVNQKGGVGKTTTAVNVSAALARQGRRVLLIDLDPQSHATMHLGLELGPDDKSVYDVLVGGVPLETAVRPVAERLALVPADLELAAAEVELAGRPERELVLARALAACQWPCDFLIIDAGPSLGLMTINALAAVEEVLIPLQPHFLALQGLGKLLETVSLVRGVLKPDLHVSGVVLCLYEAGTRLAREVRSDVSQFIRHAEFRDAWYGARVFETCVRRNIKLAECPSFGRTIFDYAPRCRGAADYAALANEILAMDRPAPGRPAPPVTAAAASATRGQPAEQQSAQLIAGPLSRDQATVAGGRPAAAAVPCAVRPPLSPSAHRCGPAPTAAPPDRTDGGQGATADA